jgi:hypothetical protein
LSQARRKLQARRHDCPHRFRDRLDQGIDAGMARCEIKIGWAKHHHPRWTKRVTGKTK